MFSSISEQIETFSKLKRVEGNVVFVSVLDIKVYFENVSILKTFYWKKRFILKTFYFENVSC